MQVLLVMDVLSLQIDFCAKFSFVCFHSLPTTYVVMFSQVSVILYWRAGWGGGGVVGIVS